MGMQDKLLKAYIQGCNDTWDLIDAATVNVPGIGPKTKGKLIEAIRVKAAEEVKVVDSLRPAERKKLHNTIDQIGFIGGA